jgi:hypothetical protein
MKLFIFFFIKNLLILHRESFLIKIKATTLLAIPLSTAAWLINQAANWGISNQEYIAGVLTCIAIDHMIGSIYHAFKVRDFTFKRNAAGLTAKLALCAASAILFEIIHHTLKDIPLVYDYLKIVTRLIVILYPAGSAFMNMSALTNGAFPPLGWIKKIKEFNQNLDLDKFKS